MSAFANYSQGDKVKTRNGGVMTFLAFVPEAKPANQVVVFDGEDILTFWADGVFMTDRDPCGLDLIPHD